MRASKITAKYPGTCRSCAAAIKVGQTIYWQRGRGAVHANCETARLQANTCPACSGRGMGGWQGNTPCGRCDGTGRLRADDVDNQPGHIGEDYPCSDRGYEDQCARAVDY